MKGLIIILAFYVTTGFANPEISVNANSSFCHWPQDSNNANNESFQGSCSGTVTQNADGTGTGSVRMVVQYPYGQAPFADTTTFDGLTAPALDCEMDDTNGTSYVSADDWEFSAVPKDIMNKHKLRRFQKHMGTDNLTYDLNGDGVINGLDIGLFRKRYGYTEVTYSMTCRNGVQQ
jgi:hypothetical protein